MHHATLIGTIRTSSRTAAIVCMTATVFGSASPCRAQLQPAASQGTQAPTAAPAAFPAAWVGHWKGEVEVLGPGPSGPAFTKELVIAPTDTPGRYTWTIIYDGSRGRQERPYFIVAKDPEKGLFDIDENNGITLPARLLGNVLHTAFTIQGNRITTREEFNSPGTPDAHITFELSSFDEAAPTKTGGGEVPDVLAWTPTSVQRATLRRVTEKDAGASGARSAPLAAGEKPAAAAPAPAAQPVGRDTLAASGTSWTRLTTEPYRGKQDDIFFLTPDLGWYVNGAGKIFKTSDAGATWTQQVHMEGTYFRCIAFVDENLGFAGNIGPGYFPNVTDPVPLYRTEDGGTTWSPVTTIDGPPVVGLCALEVVRVPMVNAGNLEYRTRIVGVGRVGGPSVMIVSDDLGKTWQRVALPESCAMAFDVHFFDLYQGVIAAASSANVEESHATILTTIDGAKTWTEAYRSQRPFELTWKISFPSRNVGYVTIQSYNPDPAASARFVAKTIDAGKTWAEIPLVDDARVRQFGVAFVDENRGWIGAMPGGFETTDGGQTWTKADFGNAVNKIRVLKASDATYLHAIGVNASSLKLPK